jgi:hypothetical protein
LEIQKLERFIRENTALADTPFIVIFGKAVTPREALQNLKVGKLKEEIRVAVLRLRPLSLDDLLILVEEHYRRLLSKPPPYPKIMWLGGELTYEQALEEIRKRTPRGKELARSYQSLLNEIGRRLLG